MDRRSFLRLGSIAGLSVAMPSSPSLAAIRPRAAYDGPCYIFVSAMGGWDPVHLCDPKGSTDLESKDRLTNYGPGDILTAGNIKYAPFGTNDDFFQKHYKKLTVINGIDTSTNGHASGQRHIFSGQLGEGFPSLAALIAGHYDPTRAMSFLSFGGYDLTQGVVSRTRSGNVGALSRIAYPDRYDTNKEDALFIPKGSSDLVAAARKARDEDLRRRLTLPRAKDSFNTLFTAQQGANELRKLQEYIPELDRSGNPLLRQAQLAIAAYRAGLCISANLSVGGFDTHNNHDESHANAMSRLLNGVDFILQEAERQQVAGKVVVVVGSDFGRTPRYNNQNGKDHWSITSMMIAGAGITGNRVVGSTDERHNPIAVNPKTLAADAKGGMRIEPKHVHQALREHAKVHDGELARLFPLSAESMPLL